MRSSVASVRTCRRNSWPASSGFESETRTLADSEHVDPQIVGKNRGAKGRDTPSPQQHHLNYTLLDRIAPCTRVRDRQHVESYWIEEMPTCQRRKIGDQIGEMTQLKDEDE